MPNQTAYRPRHLALATVTAFLLAVFPVLAAAASSAAIPELRIGCAISLTGRFGNSGSYLRRAYDTVAAWINGRGGVLVGTSRQPLRLVYRDDGSDPSRTATEIRHLLDVDKVAVLLGPYGAASVAAAAEVAAKRAVPMVHASGVSALRASGPPHYTFGTLDSGDSVMSSLAPPLAALGVAAPRVALVILDSLTARDAISGYRRASARLGHTLVFEEILPGGTTLDQGALTRRVVASRPDVLLLAGSPESLRPFLRELRTAGPRLPFVGLLGGNLAPDYVKLFGPDAENLFLITPWDRHAALPGDPSEKGEGFAQLYWRLHGERPDHHAAAAGAALMALHGAIVAAGSAGPGAVRNALERLTLETSCGIIRFATDGTAAGGGLVHQIQGGAARRVHPASETSPRHSLP